MVLTSLSSRLRGSSRGLCLSSMTDGLDLFLVLELSLGSRFRLDIVEPVGKVESPRMRDCSDPDLTISLAHDEVADSWLLGDVKTSSLTSVPKDPLVSRR